MSSYAPFITYILKYYRQCQDKIPYGYYIHYYPEIKYDEHMHLFSEMQVEIEWWNRETFVLRKK